jgi:hypothetical protein
MVTCRSWPQVICVCMISSIFLIILCTNILDTADEDPEVHLGQLKQFSFKELLIATSNFSRENLVGTGGFGKVLSSTHKKKQ